MSISFDEFQASDYLTWKSQAIKDLKGADFDEKLNWVSLNGVHGTAFYTRETSRNIFVPEYKTKAGWAIAQSFDVVDCKKSNEEILHALNNGVEEITLYIRTENPDLTVLFENVLIQYIRTNISATKNILSIAESFLHYCNSTQIDTTRLEGGFIYDPIQYCISHGDFHIVEPFVESEKLIKYVSLHFPLFNAIGVKGNYYALSGASVVQELAFSLSHLVEYLHRLSDLGIDEKEVISKISFTINVGLDFFVEIAKVKAFKLLLHNIVKAYSISVDSINVYAIAQATNRAHYDEYNNVLRITTQAMSAILSNVNSVELPNFSLLKNDNFANRITTNIQHILREESHFEDAQMAYKGNYYIQHLIEEIANEAWILFQQIEQQGGFLYALKNNFIQNEITKSIEQKNKFLQQEKVAILGVNKFKNKSESKIELNANKAEVKAVFCQPILKYNLTEQAEIQLNQTL